MGITIKLVGALRYTLGTNTLTFNREKCESVRELIKEVAKLKPEIRKTLIDQQLDDPRPNALILVNGKEISVLEGLDTILNEGDEVVLVSVVHGG